MEKMYEEKDDEIQIDLLELLFAFRRKLWLIILAALIIGAGAGVYSKVILTPEYISTAMMYVFSKDTTLTSLADLQMGSQLTNDYKIVVTSRPVLQEVIDDLQLGMEYKDLKEIISVDNPADTRILTISVRDTDPVRAQLVVNKVAETSSRYIGDIMEMVPPKMIEEGVVPVNQVSPNVKKNAVIGAAAGIFLVCAVITLQVVMNDSIRSEEDVERYLGVPVLALIPERDKKAAKDETKARSRKKVTKEGR